MFENTSLIIIIICHHVTAFMYICMYIVNVCIYIIYIYIYVWVYLCVYIYIYNICIYIYTYAIYFYIHTQVHMYCCHDASRMLIMEGNAKIWRWLWVPVSAEDADTMISWVYPPILSVKSQDLPRDPQLSLLTSCTFGSLSEMPHQWRESTHQIHHLTDLGEFLR